MKVCKKERLAPVLRWLLLDIQMTHLGFSHMGVDNCVDISLKRKWSCVWGSWRLVKIINLNSIKGTNLVVNT